MRIKPLEVKRRVGILTDPTPTFMSLVDHGANQTPWNSVKRDASASPTANLSKDEDMSLKAGKGSQRKPVVTRITLSKTAFPSIAKVKAYLKAKGFEGCGEVEDGDDVWIVPSTDDHSALKLDKPRAVAAKSDAGVTVFVAEILGKADAAEDDDDDDTDEDEDAEDGTTDEADEDDGEEDTEEEPTGKRARAKLIEPAADKKAKKTEEPADADTEYDTVLEFPETPEGTKKFDWWAMYMSDEGSLTGVLADGIGYDGVPPGVDILIQAAYYTIGNILDNEALEPEEIKAKLVQMGEDLGTLAFGLHELFSTAQDNATKSESARKFVETYTASVAAAKSTKLGEFGNVAKQAPAAKADGETAADDTTAATEETPASEDRIMKMLEKMQEDSNKRFAQVEARVSAAHRKAEKATSRAPSRKSLASAADDLIDSSRVEDEETPEQREERLNAAKRDLGGAFGWTPGGRSGS